MFDQEQFKDHPARFDQGRRHGPYDHVVRRRRRTRRGELTRRPLHFNEADAAGPEGVKLVVMAQGRHPSARGLGRIEDGRAHGQFNFFPVNRYCNVWHKCLPFIH